MQVSGLLVGKGSDVVTVSPDVTVERVASVLSRHRIGAVVVSGDGSAIDGIVSERDIVRALAGQGAGALGQPASSIMTSDVVTCGPATTVEQLMGLMTERRIRHVPVLDDERLGGIVSIGDVVKNRLSDLENETQVLHDYIAHGR
ncbi:MAG: CBS domain-containing protein [Acidimicrobiia bacterium]|nr:CBS domain-containing protein [Acidimicrobiia bacterium]